MGNSDHTNCCRLYSKYSSMNSAENESDLSDAIREEKITLHENLTHNMQEGKLNLQKQEFRKKSKDVISKLETMVCELDDNFYSITLCRKLHAFEERFQKEKFKEFLFVKKLFIDYYIEVTENLDYYNLMSKSTRLNDILNEEVIIK